MVVWGRLLAGGRSAALIGKASGVGALIPPVTGAGRDADDNGADEMARPGAPSSSPSPSEAEIPRKSNPHWLQNRLFSRGIGVWH
jgi:hypothetical protein